MRRPFLRDLPALNAAQTLAGWQSIKANDRWINKGATYLADVEIHRSDIRVGPRASVTVTNTATLSLLGGDRRLTVSILDDFDEVASGTASLVIGDFVLKHSHLFARSNTGIDITIPNAVGVDFNRFDLAHDPATFALSLFRLPASLNPMHYSAQAHQQHWTPQLWFVEGLQTYIDDHETMEGLLPGRIELQEWPFGDGAVEMYANSATDDQMGGELDAWLTRINDGFPARSWEANRSGAASHALPHRRHLRALPAAVDPVRAIKHSDTHTDAVDSPSIGGRPMRDFFSRHFPNVKQLIVESVAERFAFDDDVVDFTALRHALHDLRTTSEHAHPPALTILGTTQFHDDAIAPDILFEAMKRYENHREWIRRLGPNGFLPAAFWTSGDAQIDPRGALSGAFYQIRHYARAHRACELAAILDKPNATTWHKHATEIRRSVDAAFTVLDTMSKPEIVPIAERVHIQARSVLHFAALQLGRPEITDAFDRYWARDAPERVSGLIAGRLPDLGFQL